ncbi:MAG: HEAT repeat domain-containing protein [Verrucomicrobiales bacterium]|nr:HEAT repeat domain-containing protein [Verrucomicrobiales bacterium]
MPSILTKILARAGGGVVRLLIVVSPGGGELHRTEAELLGVLESDAPNVAKAEACKHLRLVGTARAVPALSALLTNEPLAQAARHALEAIPGAEADAALRDALAKTTGLLRAGIADSIGWRQDARAVPALTSLLGDADPTVASAGARALGRIGGRDALAALQGARGRVVPGARLAVSEALLLAAEAELAAGRSRTARSVFALLARSDEPEPVRIAAHAGLLRCAGRRLPGRIESALTGPDAAAQFAALAVARTAPDPAVTRSLIAVLSRAEPPLQVALLELLRERGDPTCVAAVLGVARSPNVTVRTAAWRALGDLGDASHVPLLIVAATSSEAAEQKAAREALASLRRGAVCDALVAELRQAPARQRVEAIRALSERGEPAAVPALLEQVEAGGGEVRHAALQALSRLAEAAHVAQLGELLVRAPDEALRAEILDVFESLAERNGRLAEPHASALARVLSAAAPPARSAAFRVCALFVSEPLREVLRAGLKSAEPGVRTAAARALCEARDASLLPELTVLAQEADDAGLRSLAIAGAVRLAGESSAALAPEQRIGALEAMLRVATRTEDKRRVLSGLARVPCARALALVEAAAADPSVRAEAEAARKQIEEQLAKAGR